MGVYRLSWCSSGASTPRILARSGLWSHIIWPSGLLTDQLGGSGGSVNCRSSAVCGELDRLDSVALCAKLDICRVGVGQGQILGHGARLGQHSTQSRRVGPTLCVDPIMYPACRLAPLHASGQMVGSHWCSCYSCQTLA